MKFRFASPILALLLCAPALHAQPVAPAVSYAAPAVVEVAQIATVWRDEKRRRDVPVKVFYPRATGPFPLIILSHGLGGSRDGLDYIGHFWATHGYVCAQIQHIGTDESVWRGAPDEAAARAALSRAASNLTNILNRPRDVTFAIDQMLALNGDTKSELNGKINADEIGVAGHSLGGFTALASAGETLIGGGATLNLGDPRIKACVAMSAPINPNGALADQFAEFVTPTFYAVGADDNSVLGATIAHRQIYDVIDAPDQYLLILAGADHMALGGQRLGDDLPGDAAIHALVQTATLAFWDAELKGNEAAKSWLKDDFSAELEGKSSFESK